MSRASARRAAAPVTPETVEAELTGMGPGGEATGALADGESGNTIAVTAAFGLPGERVVMEVLERGPDHVRGRVVRVLQPSPERIAPECPYFGTCGGCQWQHMPYERQRHWKRQMVVESLAAVGLVGVPVFPTLAAPEPYGYRNHGRFSIGRRHGEAGYTTHYRHRFMRVDHCPIMHPRIEEILRAAQQRVRGHQLAVRIGIRTGDLLINGLTDAGDLPFPSGQTALEEEVAGRRYRISAAAFFQVNTRQAERLVDTVRAGLALGHDDTLLDLYCGVGTFGLALAPGLRRVVGVEESVAALRDARHNARDLDNVEFLVGRAEEVLAGLDERIDAAIVDPPRSGCRPDALEALIRLAPRKLAYVSCDPTSLARDLRVLVDGGFTLRSAQPVDMFPQTYHVETVALLSDE